MKSYLLLFFTALILSTPSIAQEEVAGINWITLEEAQTLNKETPKKILIDLYTPWCGYCKKMDRETFTNADVIKQVNENFYAVKFNCEGPDDVTFNEKEYSNKTYDQSRPPTSRNGMHDLADFFKVPGYPSLIILDTDLSVKGKHPGYKNPAQLLQMLKPYGG